MTSRSAARVAPLDGEGVFSAEDPRLAAEGEVEHGEVFTRRWVVELILDLVGYTVDRDLAGCHAIEPACGSGAFLVPMVERLMASAETHGRAVEDAASAITATDLRPANVDASRAAVEAVLLAHGVDPLVAAPLAAGWVHHRDFLLSPPTSGTAEFVVGNPPYIRLEAIPKARAAAYRRTCPTMGGRADIYIGFYELGLRALKPGGILGFICADRWLRNQYGARLRELVSGGWAVEAVISMTGVDAFEDEVDAYPAITAIRRGDQERGPLVVSAEPSFGARDAVAVSKLARKPQMTGTDRAHFKAARLNHWFEGSGGWPHGTPNELAAIADLEDRHPPLEDVATGTRVGIGIATGADGVFITDDPELVEQERLVPLALPSDIASGRLVWSGRYLINPWEAEGLVSLDQWPRFAAVLTQHRERLAGRHTARRGSWFRTIDRLAPALTARPKLYLPDFKDRMFPVLDEGSTYPHHNLYWITSDAWDLRVLGGLLMSGVANLFISAYSVRMRGGFYRFQAQYLRRIRVPRMADLDAGTAAALALAFDQRDEAAATEVALPLYGLRELPS